MLPLTWNTFRIGSSETQIQFHVVFVCAVPLSPYKHTYSLT